MILTRNASIEVSRDCKEASAPKRLNMDRSHAPLDLTNHNLTVDHLLRWQKQVHNIIREDLLLPMNRDPLEDPTPDGENIIPRLHEHRRPRKIYIVKDKSGCSGKTLLCDVIRRENPHRVHCIKTCDNALDVIISASKARDRGWTGDCLIVELSLKQCRDFSLVDLLKENLCGSLWVLVAGYLRLPSQVAVSDKRWTFFEMSADIDRDYISLLKTLTIPEAYKAHYCKPT